MHIRSTRKWCPFMSINAARVALGTSMRKATNNLKFLLVSWFALVFVTSPDSSLGPADASAAASAVASVVGR